MKIARRLLPSASLFTASCLAAAAVAEGEIELAPLRVEAVREEAPAFAITVAAEDLPPVTAGELLGEADLPPLMAVGSLEDAEAKPMPKILVTGSRRARLPAENGS